MLGEDQIMERMAMKSKEEFSKQNGKSASELYVKVAYGIVALNTMLHNPRYDKKATFEDFIGYDTECLKADVTSSLLTAECFKVYFEDLKANPIKAVMSWSDNIETFELFYNI